MSMHLRAYFDVSAPCAPQFPFDCEEQIPLEQDLCVLWWHSTKRGLHQLVTISLKRQWSHSLWATWHQRHTVAICWIIPLVNNGTVSDWICEKWLSPESKQRLSIKTELKGKKPIMRVHQSRHEDEAELVYHFIAPQSHLRIRRKEDDKNIKP